MALTRSFIDGSEAGPPVYAIEDILIPNDVAGYGHIMVARAGQLVPPEYRDKVTDGQVTNTAPDGSAPASAPVRDDKGSGDDLENMTKEQLKQLATEAGYELASGLNKAEMVEALTEAGITGPAPA